MNIAETPMVSVVVPTYNRAHLVGRAIRSILAQTYEDFEVILVDDASTDNTEAVVRAFDDRRIRYLRHDQNRRGSAARNTGILAAQGEYIAFLDSDDEWLPRYLEKSVQAMQSAPPDVGLVYSRMVRVIGQYEFVVPRRGLRAQESVFDYLFLHGGFIPICTLLVKRNLLADTLFDEDLFPHEMGVLLRLEKLTRFHYLDDVLALWRNEREPSLVGLGAVPAPEATRRFVEKYRSAFAANREALASFLYQRGIACLTGMRLADAREFLRESIRLHPLRVKPIVLFLSTYMGKRFIAFLFRLLEVKIKVWTRTSHWLSALRSG